MRFAFSLPGRVRRHAPADTRTRSRDLHDNYQGSETREKRCQLTIRKSDAGSLFFTGVTQIYLILQTVEKLELIELSDVTQPMGHAREGMFATVYSGTAKALRRKIPVTPQGSHRTDIGRDMEQSVDRQCACGDSGVIVAVVKSRIEVSCILCSAEISPTVHTPRPIPQLQSPARPSHH